MPMVVPLPALLVLNAGSSSLQFSVFPANESLRPSVHGLVDGIGIHPRFTVGGGTSETVTAIDHRGGFDAVAAWLERHLNDARPVAVGHRVVHGGWQYDRPVRVDAAVLAVLDSLVPLAPLHQPQALAARRARGSVDTPMSFSALAGLPMGTRVGDLDPAVVLYLEQARGMTADEVQTLLYTRSGLLGLSGVSSDVRDLLASREPRARLALDYFAYRVAREVGALAVSLGGLDALV